MPTGAGYSDVIAAGQFVAGPQVIDTLPLNSNAIRWMGGELTFRFANDTAYPAGTYLGAVTFTATFVP